MSRPTEFHMNLATEQTPTPQQYYPKCTNDGGTPLSELKQKNDLISQHRGTFTRDSRFRNYNNNAFQISNPLVGPGAYNDNENFKKQTKKACKTLIKGQNYESKYESMNELLLRKSANSSQSSQRSKPRKFENRPASISSNDSLQGWRSQKQNQRKVHMKDDYRVQTSGKRKLRRPASSLPRSNSASQSPQGARFASLKRKNSENKQMPPQMFIQCTNLIQINPMRGDVDRRLNYMLYKQDSNMHRAQLDKVMNRKKLKSKSKPQQISIRPSGYNSLVPVERRTRDELQEQPTIKEVTKANQKQVSSRILKDISKEKMKKYAQKRHEMYKEFFGLQQSREGSVSSQRKHKKLRKNIKAEEMPQIMKSELLESQLFQESGGDRRSKYSKDQKSKVQDRVDQRAIEITQLKFNDVQNVMHQQTTNEVQHTDPTPINEVISPVQFQSSNPNQISEFKTSSKTMPNQDILDIKCVQIKETMSRTNLDMQNDPREVTINSQALAMQSTQQPFQSSMQSSITYHHDNRAIPEQPSINHQQKTLQQPIPKARSRPMSAKNATSFGQKNILMKSSLRRGGAGVGPTGYSEFLLSKGSHRTLRSNNQIQEQIIKEEDDLNYNSIQNDVLSPQSSQMQISTNQPARYSKHQVTSTTNQSQKPPRGSITSKLPNQSTKPVSTAQQTQNTHYLDNYKTVIHKTFKERSNSQKVKKPISGRTAPVTNNNAPQRSSSRFRSNNSTIGQYKPSSYNRIDSNIDILQQQPSSIPNQNNIQGVQGFNMQKPLRVPSSAAIQQINSSQGPYISQMNNSRHSGPVQLKPLSSKPAMKTSLFSPVLTQENMRQQFEIANQQEQLRKASNSPNRHVVPATKLDMMAKQLQKQPKSQNQKKASTRSLLDQQKNQIKDAKKLKEAINVLIDHVDPQTLNEILKQKQVSKFVKQQVLNHATAQQIIATAQLSDSTLQSIPEQHMKTFDNNAVNNTNTYSPIQHQRHQVQKLKSISNQQQHPGTQTNQLNKPATTNSLDLAHIYDPYSFKAFVRPSTTKSSFRRRRTKKATGNQAKMNAQLRNMSHSNEYNMHPQVSQELQYHFQTAPQDQIAPSTYHQFVHPDTQQVIQTVPDPHLANTIQHPQAPYMHINYNYPGTSGVTEMGGLATIITEPMATVTTDPALNSDYKVVLNEGNQQKYALPHDIVMGDQESQMYESPDKSQTYDSPPKSQTYDSPPKSQNLLPDQITNDAKNDEAPIPNNEPQKEPVEVIQTEAIEKAIPQQIKQETLSLGEANADLLEVVDVNESKVENISQQEPNERSSAQKEEPDEDQKLNEDNQVEQNHENEQSGLIQDLKDSSKALLKPSTNVDLDEIQEPTDSQTQMPTQALDTEIITNDAVVLTTEPVQQMIISPVSQDYTLIGQTSQQDQHQQIKQEQDQTTQLKNEPSPVSKPKQNMPQEVSKQINEQQQQDQLENDKQKDENKLQELNIEDEEKNIEVNEQHIEHQQKQIQELQEQINEKQDQIQEKSVQNLPQNRKSQEMKDPEKTSPDDDYSDDQEMAGNVIYNSIDQNDTGKRSSKLAKSDQINQGTDQNSSEINAMNAADFIDSIQVNVDEKSKLLNKEMPLQGLIEQNKSSIQSSLQQNSSELNAQIAQEYIQNLPIPEQNRIIDPLKSLTDQSQQSLPSSKLHNSSELNAKVASEYIDNMVNVNQNRMKIENQNPHQQSKKSESQLSEKYSSSDQVQQQSSERASIQQQAQPEINQVASNKQTSEKASTQAQNILNQQQLTESSLSSAGQFNQQAASYIDNITEVNQYRIDITKKMKENLIQQMGKHILAKKQALPISSQSQEISNVDKSKSSGIKLSMRIEADSIPPEEIPPAGHTARLRDLPTPSMSGGTSDSPNDKVPEKSETSQRNPSTIQEQDTQSKQQPPTKESFSFQVVEIAPQKDKQDLKNSDPSEIEQSQSQFKQNSNTTTDQNDKEVEQIIVNYNKHKSTQNQNQQAKNDNSNLYHPSQPSQLSYGKEINATPLPQGQVVSQDQLVDSKNDQFQSKKPLSLTIRQDLTGQEIQLAQSRPISSQEQRPIRTQEDEQTENIGEEERGVQQGEDIEESITIGTGLRDMAQVIETKGSLVRVPGPLEESASSSIVILDKKNVNKNNQNQAVNAKEVSSLPQFTHENKYTSQQFTNNQILGTVQESLPEIQVNEQLITALESTEQLDQNIVGQSLISMNNPVTSSFKTPITQMQNTLPKPAIHKDNLNMDGREDSSKDQEVFEMNRELADPDKDANRGRTDLQKRIVKKIENGNDKQGKLLDMKSVATNNTQQMRQSWTERVPQDQAAQDETSHHSSSIKLRIASSIHISDSKRKHVVPSKSESEDHKQ